MHMKDADREKRAVARIIRGIRMQIRLASLPILPAFDRPSIVNQEPSHGHPHQGKREIERRRKRIASGKLTEADGLIGS